MTSRLWLRDRPEPSVVWRALGISVAWSYVAGLAALVLVGVVALVSLIVNLVGYFFDSVRDGFDLGTAWEPAVLVGWIVAPIALGVSIWVAAYGSTSSESVRRSFIATALAAIVGVGLWFAGTLGFVVATPAVGWTMAIPAEHPQRWVVRLLGAGAAVAFYPPWDELSTVALSAGVVTAPLVAGLCVLIGDLVWIGVDRVRSRRSEDTLRAPSSLDV